jgi:ATP-dependent Clp protease ATP-binding subunit ClpA
LAEQKFYKVICNEINLVLLLKKLTMREERRTYHDVKKKIEGLDKPITIDSYITFVVKAFLYDAEEFFNNLPQDKEDKDTITRAVYASIIEAYPPFDLEFVCADINNGTFMEEMHESLAAVLSTAAQAEAPPKSLKAIKTLNDVNNLERYLSKNLIGQEQAVKGLVDSMKLVASGLYKNASFFFIGPTGVGKTELARLVGNRYSGNFWKVNCAEYAQAHEYAKLIGSPPGYVGHSEKSLMAEKAEKSNKWVILFDEIEKAHTKFYDFLLSLLDDGTCTDNMGRVLDFTESIFIFTSNQGVSDIRVGKKLGFGGETVSVSGSEQEITQSVKKKFPAEFMNRIDNYVFFNTLEPQHLKKIATLALSNIPIKRHKALLDFIVEHGYSEEYGARNIKRFIKNEVATVIAQALLERRLPSKKGDLYTPKVKDGKLTLTCLTGDEEELIDQAAG